MQVSDSPKFDDRLVLKVDSDLKQRVHAAAKVRDGGNVSHLVRRAIVRLLLEEGLERDQAQEGQAA